MARRWVNGYGPLNVKKLFIVTLLCLSGVVFWASASTDKPSVLRIILDQQFADAVSCPMGKQFINTNENKPLLATIA